MISKIFNIGHLPVTYIFKATFKSSRDSQVIDLVSVSTRRMLPGHFITRTVLECCSANNQMMGAAEIHKTAAQRLCGQRQVANLVVLQMFA